MRQSLRGPVFGFFVLLSAARPAAAQVAPTLQVVSFKGELVLQVGNQIVVLKPGMPGYSLPQNQEIGVLSGEALLLAGKTLISVAPDDHFTYVAVGGQPRLWIHEGGVKTFSAGRAVTYAKGDVVTVAGEVVAAPPASPPPSEPEKLEKPAEQPEIPEPPPVPPSMPAPRPESPAPRAAREPLRIKIEVHPYAYVKETYDDNIYLVARDKPGPETVGGGVVGSWISNANLGFKFSSPLSRKQKVTGGLDLSAAKYSKQARVNDAYGTTVNAAYEYAGKEVKAALSNSYQNTELPAFSELVVRKRHWQDETRLALDWSHGRRLILGLDAQHSITKYVDPTLGGLLNHYEQSVGARAGIALKPKTKAYVSYRRVITHYSAGRNAGSKGHQVDANLEGEIAPRLTGLASAGAQHRRYDGAAGLSPTLTDWRTSVTLKYEASKNVKTDFRLFRNLSESTFGINRYYTATGANLAASWTLRRLVSGVNGSVEFDRYPEFVLSGGLSARRRDDLYSWGVSEEYKFREWLRAGLSFTRLTRFSIFSRQFNYADDRTTLEVKAAF